MKPTAQELTDEKIAHDAEQERIRDYLKGQYEKSIKHHIAYAVGEGRLDAERAEEMSFEEMEDYVDWSDFAANSQRDMERERNC